MKTLNKAATATVCIKYSKKNLCHFDYIFVFVNELEDLFIDSVSCYHLLSFEKLLSGINEIDSRFFLLLNFLLLNEL